METSRWPEGAGARNWSSRVRVPRAELRLGWVTFLDIVPWDVFVTMTFDPKQVYPVTCDRAGKEAFTWCGIVGWALRRPVAWLIAPERGKSGQWHAHVLLAGVPRDISALAELWQIRNGRIHLRPVDDLSKATLYATKQEASSGEVILSDTLALYRDRRTDVPRVAIYSPTHARQRPVDEENVKAKLSKPGEEEGLREATEDTPPENGAETQDEARAEGEKGGHE